MSQASSLERFTLFLNNTREHLLSSPDTLVSQASKHSAHFIRRMLAGRDPTQFVQGGSRIVDYVQLDYTNTFRPINPDGQVNYTGVGKTTPLEVPWRFYATTDTISEVELDLNQNDNEKDVFKRVKKVKMANMELSQWEGMEDALWADPNYETMESPTSLGGAVGDAFSIRSYITVAGGAPATADGLAAGSTDPWTTLMTVSPTAKPNWQNQVSNFDGTCQATREATYIPAMDKLWIQVQFKSPSTSQEYITDTNMNRYVIANNLSSQTMLVALATAKNNVLTPNNDIGWANGSVVYHGIQMVYVPRLNTADTGANAYRSRFINLNDFKIIVHNKHYAKLRTLAVGAQQPYVQALFQDTWWNLWCANRRQQGIVTKT